MIITSRHSLYFLLVTFLTSLGITQAQPLAAPVEVPAPTAAGGLTNAEIYSSVVRIECSTQVYDYQQPWTAGRFGGGIGTGFLIGENKFLTNAHVVSDARRIIINKRGSDIKHNARILHIAHDCDLALLEVEDFSAFEGLPYLSLSSDVPKLESEVKAVGYPVGGNRLSVTRGVVSRIDFRPYAHSQIDMHLVVQVDAAINPGNSGGPVLQGDQVVGVAFQGLTQADNTGYMIPPPVIERFLKDIQDGQYDHYVDLGVSHFTLFNPTMKRALGLAQNAPGVYISDVTPGLAAEGVLQRGDVLIKIDGNLIDNGGYITVDGEQVLMHESVERKFAGDEVTVTFIRDGKEQQEVLTLRPSEASRIYAVSYDVKPRYFFKAGLLFQPLNFNLMRTYNLSNPAVRTLYQNYVDDGIFKERDDLVVLTQIFDDALTSNFTGFTGRIVKTVNDTPIKSLKHLHAIFAGELPEYTVIHFEGSKRPLVLPSSDLSAADARIGSRLGITLPANL